MNKSNKLFYFDGIREFLCELIKIFSEKSKIALHLLECLNFKRSHIEISLF